MANLIANEFLPIVEQCRGCERIITQAALTPKVPDIDYCRACIDPSFKWKNGKCNLATHIKVKEKAKVHVDPIKASKKMMGVKKK